MGQKSKPGVLTKEQAEKVGPSPRLCEDLHGAQKLAEATKVQVCANAKQLAEPTAVHKSEDLVSIYVLRPTVAPDASEGGAGGPIVVVLAAALYTDPAELVFIK